MHQHFLLSILIFTTLFACQPASEESSEATQPALPNIVFILADDMGYGDPGSYNPESKIPTPNIDQIAQNGVKFTDAHSPGPWCVPSRYGLITGQYPYRTQLNWRERALIDPDQRTIAELLKEHGYRTGMVGKWHLGFDNIDWDNIPADQEFRGGPVDQGFDEFFGMHASLDIPPYFYIEGNRAVEAPTDTVADNQSEDATTSISGAFWRGGDMAPGFSHEEVLPKFTQRAVSFLEQQSAEQPFFLYLALTAPHTPWVPTEEFAGSTTVGEYGDFIRQVDHTVGTITRLLDSLGFTENTLLIFTSDNGPVWFPEDVEKFDHQSTASLRGMKIDLWEGGHRIPFVAQWPGKIPAGTERNDLMGFTDMYATLAAVVGDSSSLSGKDSYDMLPAFRNEATEPIRREMIIGEDVVRQGNWKFIRDGGGGGLGRSYGYQGQEAAPEVDELYNLAEDLSETNNLTEEQPEKVEELNSLLPKIQSQ